MQQTSTARDRPIVRTLLQGRQRLVVLLALLSVLGGLAEAVFLVVLTRVALAITTNADDVSVLGGRTISVGAALLLAPALVLTKIASAIVLNSLSAKLNADVTNHLRTGLARAFLGSTWAAQQSSRSGQLQELTTNYAGSGAALLSNFTAAVSAGFSLIALLGLAAVVNPLGTLVAAGALALLGSILRPLRARIQAYAKAAADDGMALALDLNEISGLGLEMHVFDVRPAIEDRLVRTLEIGKHSLRRVTVVRGLVPSIYTGLAYLALVGAVALANLWGGANLSSLGAVMLVMLRSLSYGQQLQLGYSGISSYIPSVRDLFSEQARLESLAFVDHGQPVSAALPLELDNVTFEYNLGQPVLHDVSARLEEHELIGVVGPSGSGKSTLVQLLLGIRTPTRGQVRANGVEIDRLRHSDWARVVSFVPQKPVLVSGTIADNIRFYRAGITDAEVQRAAERAGIHDEVLGFPAGYEHQVGDNGRHLSGGQQQRICIARALATQPELLILDEPTSALDARSESIIRGTIDSLRTSMTVIVIAHRLSTLEDCDRILILQEGRISAFDTPHRLREQQNFYAEALRLSGAGNEL